jgi:hypothetical protein
VEVNVDEKAMVFVGCGKLIPARSKNTSLIPSCATSLAVVFVPRVNSQYDDGRLFQDICDASMPAI